MKTKYFEAMRNFKNKKVAVIGDIMLDRREFGIISKKENPEDKNVPIILAREEFYLGGASNVAKNIVSLGAKCDLYGIYGSDIYGNKIEELCKENEINNFCEKTNLDTIVKSRIFIDEKYSHRSDFGELSLKKINPEIQEKIIYSLDKNPHYDAVIISDYNKSLFTSDFSQEIIKLFNKKCVPIFVDPKPQNIECFKNSKIICPNAKEAEKITGIKYLHDLKTLEKMGENLSKKINSDEIIITCSENGSYVYNRGVSKIIPTKAEKVVDVTGAGDSFISALSLAFVSGLNVYDSAKLANVAAGIVVEKKGTATASIEEIIGKIDKEEVL